MTRVTSNPVKPPDRDQLRRELLKLILKNEAARRDSDKAQAK
jgi:hypothetical protein